MSDKEKIEFLIKVLKQVLDDICHDRSATIPYKRINDALKAVEK